VEILARTVQATRSYGPVIALDNVSLDVPAWQLLGLLGPNGAGKTTLLQLLAGLRRPTSGTVELFGGDPREAARRRRLGCTPQETGLPFAATTKAAAPSCSPASHYLEEVEALAERVIVIDQGRVRADGTLADVRSLVPARRVRLRAPDLPELAGVDRSRRDGDRHQRCGPRTRTRWCASWSAPASPSATWRWPPLRWRRPSSP
jgi:ABC-type multidrug transport system ATPase subunit